MQYPASPIQPVILAGGSGVRLWPASRRDRPKQLLNLVGDHSLLQQAALRLRGFASAPLLPDPIVVTNKEYRLVVAEQLREIGFARPRLIIAPVVRNTAPALTSACLAVSEDGRDPIMLVMASDHLIADTEAFQQAVGEGAIQADAGRVVLFGIVPQHAETGYGYIHAGQVASPVTDAAAGPAAGVGANEAVPGPESVRSVLGFEEKPDTLTAQAYLRAGDYLWNSGMFMVKRSVWLQAIARFQPEILASCKDAMPPTMTDPGLVRLEEAAFRSCPNESIDCAVIEELVRPDASDAPTLGDRTTAVVIPLDCGWSDVGGWRALAEVSDADAEGNVVRGDVILEDTHRTLVHSDSRLVAVLGVDALVVVDTPDALLVAGRDKTADLKTLVARVEAHDPRLTDRHRRQYRPWGRFDSIDEGERFQVKHILVAPGASLSLQLHHHRAEHWVVVHGVADVTCGDRSFRLNEDESTYVPVGVTHRLSNPGPETLEIIEVQSGDYLGEDDIVRLDDEYGRRDER